MADLHHPLAVRVYDQLRARGTAPPMPRDYGLRVVSEVLRTADHIRLLETPQEQKP